jgi:hypothetical protein
MKKIALFGAFDRNNYGDILFAKIFEEYSKIKNKKYKFDFLGLKKSDLTSLGGYKTESISKKINNDYDSLILVGGDVLTVNWYSMYRCFSKNQILLKFYDIIYNLLPWRYKNSFFKLLMNGKTKFPWLVSKQDLIPNVKVIYNSVGGSDFDIYPDDYKQNFKKIIENIDYISVRDAKLKESIEKNVGKEILLSPDSALIMSEIYSLEKLKKLISEEIKNSNILKGDYIAFQVKDTIGIPNIDILVNELEKIYEKYNYPVALVPIGRAAGHSDHIPLEAIAKKLKTPYFIPKNNSIFDTMYIIGNSKLYLGTSLHGAITAFSYCKPHYALTNTVEKLSEFLKTWGIKKQLKEIDCDKIYLNFEKMITVDTKEIEKMREKAIKLVQENFDRIFKIIEN